MEKDKKDKRLRLNMTIRPDTRARIERLQEKTGAHTLTEVVRRALEFYEHEMEQRAAWFGDRGDDQ